MVKFIVIRFNLGGLNFNPRIFSRPGRFWPARSGMARAAFGWQKPMAVVSPSTWRSGERSGNRQVVAG